MLQNPLTDIQKCPIRREILDFIRSYPRAKPNHADMVLSRFGFNDGEPKTLEQIGKKYSVTRERIRQILKKYSDHAKKHFPTNLILQINIALNILRQVTPTKHDEAVNHLIREKICAPPISIEAIISLAKEFNQPVPIMIYGKGPNPIIIPHTIKSHIKPHLSWIQRKIIQIGAINLDMMLYGLPALTGWSKRRCQKFIQLLLPLNPNFERVGLRQAWVISEYTKNSFLFKTISKLTVTAQKLSLDDIKAALIRPPRARRPYTDKTDAFIFPDDVLKDIINKLPGIYMIKNEYYFDQCKENDNVFSQTELLLISAFRHFNKSVLRRAEIRDYMVEHGCTPNTFECTMTWFPNIEKVKQDIWKLRGTDAIEAQIKEADQVLRIIRRNILINNYKNLAPSMKNPYGISKKNPEGDDFIKASYDNDNAIVRYHINKGSISKPYCQLPLSVRPYFKKNSYETIHEYCFYPYIKISQGNRIMRDYQRIFSQLNVQLNDIVEFVFNNQEKTASIKLLK